MKQFTTISASLSMVCTYIAIICLAMLLSHQQKRIERLEAQVAVKQQAVTVKEMKVEVVTPVQYREGLPGFGGKR